MSQAAVGEIAAVGKIVVVGETITVGKTAVVGKAVTTRKICEEVRMLFVHYPKCSTCRRAMTWLDERGIKFDQRHIVEDNPKADELRAWHEASGLPLRRFFNTSGMRYRELGLKDKLPTMSDDEMYELLASDGMLVKRPLLVLDDTVLVGFREPEWEAALE